MGRRMLCMSKKPVASPGVIEGRNLDDGRVLITRLKLNQDLSAHHPEMLQQALGWASWGGQGRAPTKELRIQKSGVDPAHLKGDLMEQALGSMGIKIAARGSVHENGHEVAVFKPRAPLRFLMAPRLSLNLLPLNVEFLPLANYLPTHGWRQQCFARPFWSRRVSHGYPRP